MLIPQIGGNEKSFFPVPDIAVLSVWLLRDTLFFLFLPSEEIFSTFSRPLVFLLSKVSLGPSRSLGRGRHGGLLLVEQRPVPSPCT